MQYLSSPDVRMCSTTFCSTCCPMLSLSRHSASKVTTRVVNTVQPSQFTPAVARSLLHTTNQPTNQHKPTNTNQPTNTPKALDDEFVCPICLSLLSNTMTAKECTTARLVFWTSFTHLSAVLPSTRAVQSALRSALADRLLIGACNPIL